MATTSTPRLTTIEARRERSREIYKAGKSRGPYKLRSIDESLSKSSTEDESSEVGTNLSTGMCTKCQPVLARFTDTFKSMKKQGSSLKMVKRPVPRRADMDHYRDLKAQNDWLRSNVFDSMGNYLYCAKCIRTAFGISKQRLSRQRKMKQSASQEPITQITKAEVEEKRLREFIIMPSGQPSARGERVRVQLIL